MHRLPYRQNNFCNAILDGRPGLLEEGVSFVRMHGDHEPFSGRAAFHRRPSLALEEWVAVERNPPGFMGSLYDLVSARWDHEPARGRLGRSGSPAESPFEFAKSACERRAAGGTPALRFMGGLLSFVRMH